MNDEHAAARPLGLAAVALCVALPLLAPTAARADTAPAFTQRPVITGVPREPEVLTASAAWTGDPEPTVEWRWLRCAVSGGKCTAIVGAQSQAYRIVAADVGSVLRVRAVLTNSAGTAAARSAPTSAIQPAPEPPPVPEDPPVDPPVPDEPPVDPPVDPPPSPPFSLSPNPVFMPPPSAEGHRPVARLLQPFPIVRIRGRLTPAGALITLLTVRSPRGARIAVGCRGRGCPARRLARTAALTRLRPLERRLRAGTRLDMTVRKADYIGKWTTIVIRRGRPPWRSDRCVYPGRRRPTACPAG